VLVDEHDAVTTVLVARAKFLASQRALVRDFVRAHDELTTWIRANPEEAQKMVRDELSAEMHAEVSGKLVARAWGRIVPTSEVSSEALVHFVADARQAGFLRTAPDLSRLVEKP
jgi:NitT/TauT family transport system substrate-binding protein